MVTNERCCKSVLSIYSFFGANDFIIATGCFMITADTVHKPGKQNVILTNAVENTRSG